MKLHAEQLSRLEGAELAARIITRYRPTISSMLTSRASSAMARAGVVAVLLPGALYFVRETHKPPVELAPSWCDDGDGHRL